MNPDTRSASTLDLLQPLDGHNLELLRNVHPHDHVNPIADGRYNLVVVGAGAGGLVSSIGAAGLGAKVALIERSLLGGDCLNVGCVPSKSLIRAARAAAAPQGAGRLGVGPSGNRDVDFGSVMERLRRVRASISKNDSVERLQKAGVDVYLGDARFTGAASIEVAGQTLQFARAVIAVGGRPATPQIVGLREVGYLTNESVFSLTTLPRRLAIIGGGPIGCELAQAFARLGSEVHLLLGGHPLMGREDRDAAKIVEQALERDGVRIGRSGKVTEVRRENATKVLLLGRDDASERVEADEIIVAIGRSPNVEGLGLDAAGIRFDSEHGVEVNDWLQTTNGDVYAVGDICSKYNFTHMADAMARIALRNALFFGRAKVSDLTVPWCTYTSPEVAHVGDTEAAIRERGDRFDVIRVELSEVDRAVIDGDAEGFIKVYVKKGTDRILGATLVSPNAGDIISQVTLAMVAGAGLKTIGETIHPYPTEAEIVRKAADAFNRRRLTPLLKKSMTKVLRWRR